MGGTAVGSDGSGLPTLAQLDEQAAAAAGGGAAAAAAHSGGRFSGSGASNSGSGSIGAVSSTTQVGIHVSPNTSLTTAVPASVAAATVASASGGHLGSLPPLFRKPNPAYLQPRDAGDWDVGEGEPSAGGNRNLQFKHPGDAVNGGLDDDDTAATAAAAAVAAAAGFSAARQAAHLKRPGGGMGGELDEDGAAAGTAGGGATATGSRTVGFNRPRGGVHGGMEEEAAAAVAAGVAGSSAAVAGGRTVRFQRPSNGVNGGLDEDASDDAVAQKAAAKLSGRSVRQWHRPDGREVSGLDGSSGPATADVSSAEGSLRAGRLPQHIRGFSRCRTFRSMTLSGP